MNGALASNAWLYPLNESDDAHVFRKFAEKLKSLVKARSIRLLNEPSQLVYRSGAFLATDSKTTWKIRKAEGPKRYSKQVMDHKIHRDYYKIETEDSDHLCVYFCGLERRFYLHGYFE